MYLSQSLQNLFQMHRPGMKYSMRACRSYLKEFITKKANSFLRKARETTNDEKSNSS